MITSDLLKAFGLITAALCIIAIWRHWRRPMYLHWLMMLAMAFGAAGVSTFYNEVDRGILSVDQLIVISRLIWFFVLVNTSLVAISIMAYRK